MSILLARRRMAPHAFTGGAVITSDSFTGGDLANINGRALDLALGGGAKTWAQLVGTTQGIGITSGAAARQATGSARRYNFDAGTGDVFASMKVTTKPTVNFLYLTIRADAVAETYYAARFSTASVQIWKTVAGSGVLLGTAFGVVDGSTVAIQAVGSTIQLGIDGAMVISITDTDIANTTTGVGLAVLNSATGFVVDDFYVAAAA